MGIRIHRQPANSQRPAPGQQQQWVKPAGTGWCGQQRSQQLEQGVTGLHACTQPLNGVGTMQDPIAIDQHSTIPKLHTLPTQPRPQLSIMATITDLQLWDATAELTALGKLGAEQATTVVHQHWSMGSIEHAVLVRVCMS